MKKKHETTYLLTEKLIEILHAYEDLDVIDILILGKVLCEVAEVGKNECNTSNETFAYDLKLSCRSISRRIKTLVDLKLLDKEITYEGDLGAINKKRKLSLGPEALKYLLSST